MIKNAIIKSHGNNRADDPFSSTSAVQFLLEESAKTGPRESDKKYKNDGKEVTKKKGKGNERKPEVGESSATADKRSTSRDSSDYGTTGDEEPSRKKAKLEVASKKKPVMEGLKAAMVVLKNAYNMEKDVDMRETKKKTFKEATVQYQAAKEDYQKAQAEANKGSDAEGISP